MPASSSNIFESNETDMSPLIAEFDLLDKEWSLCEESLLKVVEQMIETKSDVKDVLVVEQTRWKGLHSKLSKYSKFLEKITSKYEIPILEQKADDPTEWEHTRNNAINEALVQHFYQTGNFEVADAMIHELGELHAKKEKIAVPRISESFKQPFEDLHSIMKALKEDRDIGPALEWTKSIDKNFEISEQKHLKIEGLQLMLFRINYLLMMRQGRPGSELLDYARQNLSVYTQNFLSEIEKLMGTLAFQDSLETSPYNHLLFEDLWSSTEEELQELYCDHHNLPQQSAFSLCMSIGQEALVKLATLPKLMTNAPGIDITRQLPCEMPVPKNAHFHSTFICPVLREETNEANPPMLMVCGHVISKEALDQLGKGNPSAKIKCPYCPSQSVCSSAMRIFF